MNPEDKIVEKENREPIKSLRTYQGDVEETITKNNYSTSSIFLAEQKKRDGTLINPTNGDSGARNKFFILVGGILLLLGVITLASVYFIKSSEQVNIEKQTKTLLRFSREKVVPATKITREVLIETILSEKRAFELPVNSVLYINAVDASSTPIQISSVLSLLTPSMPSSLARSFDREYMIGVYSFDTNEPFIILTTSDYASSFAGMLKWEANITADFGKLFSIGQNASTTTKVFIDESLKNKDLRVLKDVSGKTIFLYSFMDKNTLLITTNENIFGAVLGKYLVGKQTK